LIRRRSPVSWIKTEYPPLRRKKSPAVIFARNLIVVSHCPLFSTNSRLEKPDCAERYRTERLNTRKKRPILPKLSSFRFTIENMIYEILLHCVLPCCACRKCFSPAFSVASRSGSLSSILSAISRANSSNSLSCTMLAILKFNMPL